MMCKRIVVIAVIWISSANASLAYQQPSVDSPDADSQKVDFQKEVRPILANHCFACHGFDDKSRQADLRLDLPSDLPTDPRNDPIAPNRSPPTIVPGHPEASELVRRILSEDPDEIMPPPSTKKPLSATQKSILARWIAQGARYEKHWAFAPLTRPTPPEIVAANNSSANSIASNPIDRWIRSELERRKREPSPQADTATLVRRLYLDLIGTLPSPEEVEAIQADPLPNKIDRLIERLLASPQFGERWGRFWLDQARYADSNGFTIDGPRPMWPFRDWVIAAINADMPFDQFTIEQLAGDLLQSETSKGKPSKHQLIASAFHRNTMINEEGGAKADQYRHEAIVDRVNTTGAVWLGLTVGCAQCHTHKYDPISIDDYYRLYAFFNACSDSNAAGPTIDVLEGEVFGLPESIMADFAKLQQLNQQLQELEVRIKKLNEAPEPELKGEPVPTQQLEELKAQVTELSRRLPNQGKPVAQMVSQDQPQPPATYRLVRGDFLSPDQESGPLSPSIPSIFRDGRDLSMSNRLDLAKWLVSPENPLTARVMVNRVWMKLFGAGLVETENDFGLQGSAPTHPELLDWLASDWVDSGWSLKHLIHRIASSATYQQSSDWRADLAEIDSTNRLLARQSRIRLDAEILRDRALSASGSLTTRIGGPSVHPPQPAGVYNFTQNVKNWTEDTGANRYRKTMYTEFYRSAPYPLFTTFDSPDFSTVCTRRSRTNTPLQALTLANDPVFWELSLQLADRAKRELNQTPLVADLNQTIVSAKDRIRHMVRLAWCRDPSELELDRLCQFHASTLEYYRQNPAELENLGGLDIDRASDAQVARVLLNTDEFVNRD